MEKGIVLGSIFAVYKDWMVYSFKFYEGFKKENCGIFETSGYILSTVRREDVENELMKGVAPEYRPATPTELEQFPGNVKYGTFMKTLIIRCRTFLPWLQERIVSKGGTIVKKKIQNLSELQGLYDVVVNCTGLQSKWLVNDSGLTPIRGQIVKVKSQIKQFFYLDGPDTYIIPHDDGIVSLGGTCQYNVWDDRLREHDSVGIRARCAAIDPGLETAPVAWEWVGLRPHRDIVRVEAEIHNGLKIVHNYGHGGYGVTAAPGAARDATNLVKQLFHFK